MSSKPLKTLATISFATLVVVTSGCAALKPGNDSTPDYKSETTASQSQAASTSGSASNTGIAGAQRTVEIRGDAPDRYVVKKGDTLWDISAMFLKKPWYWPEIWHVNPEIRNPHLIYPGDVLSIYYVDGQPRLGINRGDYKLSPSIRSRANVAEPISVAGLRPFLLRPQIIAEEQLKAAAHIVGSQDKHLIYGTGDKLYARGLENKTIGARYSIFRPGTTLYNPRNPREVLGYEVIYASNAEVIRSGEPSTVVLEKGVREVLRGDRLMPVEPNPADMQFFPHEPPAGTSIPVISLFDALSGIAQYQVAVIAAGTREGIEPGHVMAVNQAGTTIIDEHHTSDQTPKIDLPEERSGIMMIFRTFEKVSYGLVMEASRPIRLGDMAVNP